MHHPTGRISHTTAFVIPVVEHWHRRCFVNVLLCMSYCVRECIIACVSLYTFINLSLTYCMYCVFVYVLLCLYICVGLYASVCLCMCEFVDIAI